MAGKQVCAQCYQGITNPICEKCYTKQLALWLNDQGFHPHSVQHIIAGVRKRYATESENEIFCILCGNEIVSVCTYCYFFKIDLVLRQLNFPQQMIDEFLQTFNYEIYKGEYSPTLNKLEDK